MQSALRALQHKMVLHNETCWLHEGDACSADYQRQEGDGEHLRNCDFTQQRDPNENKACRFAIENINNNCSASNNFGYEYGQPCILLKLNRVGVPLYFCSH